MKLHFEGDSIIEQIKVGITLRGRNTTAKLTDVFLTPTEMQCLRAEIGATTDDEVSLLMEMQEGFEGVRFHCLTEMTALVKVELKKEESHEGQVSGNVDHPRAVRRGASSAASRKSD